MNVLLLAIPALLCALWGWHKGALRVVTRLSVLILAYALVWQETATFAHYIAEKQWLTGVLVWPAAAAGLFLGGSFLFSACASGFLYLAPDEWKEGGKSLGAMLGGLLGSVLGVFLIWTAGVMQDAQLKRQQNETAITHTTQPITSSQRSAIDTLLNDFASTAVAKTVSTVMGDSPAAVFTSEMLRSPISVGEGFKRLAEQPDLRRLLSDPESYEVLIHGTAEEVMRLPYFQALVSDVELMRFMKSTGLAGETLAEQKYDLASKMCTYARNFEIISETPQYEALVADPAFQDQLRSGQWLQLLANDKTRELAEMLINPDTAIRSEQPVGYSIQAPGQTQWRPDNADTDTAQLSEDSPQADSTSNKTIYRWRDANGRIHLTHEKPPAGIQADAMVE
jgi:hypothetical protein